MYTKTLEKHKCGENRNHGKFKIYFLNILSDKNAFHMHFHLKNNALNEVLHQIP